MKIAVWYHCKLAGHGIPSEDAAVAIVAEQMEALKESGLAEAADEIHAAINGDDAQAMVLAAFAPAQTQLHVHGAEARTELPTFGLLQQWLPAHPDWAVLYHHSKGVTQPQDDFHHHHRRTMQAAVIGNWRQCVKDLGRGYDAVGINWVDPITRPVLPGRFFAGNFWWARVSYLRELPPLEATAPEYSLYQRMKAEGWIGSASRRPLVLDYERPELSDWCQAQLQCEDTSTTCSPRSPGTKTCRCSCR